MADIDSLEYLPKPKSPLIGVSSNDYKSLNRRFLKIESDLYTIQIESRNIIDRLKIKEGELESSRKDFISAKEYLEKISSTTLVIVIGVLVVFITTLVGIAYDFLSNNENRYEELLNKNQEMRLLISEDVSMQLKSFKDCVWFNGLSHCLR